MLLKKQGVPPPQAITKDSWFSVSKCNCSFDSLYNQLVKEKECRPLIKDLSDEQLKSYIRKKLRGRRIFYQQALLILQEDEMTVDNLVNKIFHN